MNEDNKLSNSKQAQSPPAIGDAEVYESIRTALAPNGDETAFYKHVSDLLAAARQHAKRQLDHTIVTAYYEIGRMIVEREQRGQKRAQYGEKLIQGLSKYLTEQYGRGFSVVNLKGIRKFYQVYSPAIQQTPSANLEKGQSVTAQFNLSWTHYQVLMRIENESARRFYESQ